MTGLVGTWTAASAAEAPPALDAIYRAQPQGLAALLLAAAILSVALLGERLFEGC